MENKENVLGKLYFIRAVLSEISLRKGQADELAERKQKIESSTLPKLASSNDNDEAVKLLEVNKSDLAKINSEIKDLKKDIEKNNTDSGMKIVSLIFFFVSVLISAIIIFYLGRWWINTDKNFFVGCLLFPAGLVAALWDMFCLWLAISTKTKSKIANENSIIEAKIEAKEQEKKPLLEKKAALKARIRANEKEAEAIYASNLEIYNQEKQEKIQEVNALIRTLSEETLSIYENLKKASVLDERDWGYLDVIIYEIETGRAETIKEALQQTDLYIRHNEIRNVIQNASSAICVTIKENIDDFSMLFERELTELNDKMSEYNIGQIKTQSLLSEMIDYQEMTNALLCKSNASSESMAKDIKGIRDLQYYEYYGIR